MSFNYSGYIVAHRI